MEFFELKELGERFKKFTDEKNLSDTEIGYSINTTAATVGNIKKGKNFTVKVLLQMFKSYPDLDHEWLLFGSSGRGAFVVKEPSAQYGLPPELLERMKKMEKQINELKSKIK